LDGGKLSELETIRTQLTNIKPIVNWCSDYEYKL
jgi:hypothetical protein